ncbi:MAG: hypothetical protein ACI9SP_001357 [Arenicella sp.]|jgi:hypothetical protein
MGMLFSNAFCDFMSRSPYLLGGLLLYTNVIGSGLLADSGLQQADQINYCVDDHAIEQRRLTLIEKKSRKLAKFRSSVIARNSIVIDVSESSEPIVSRGSLAMSLNAVRTKAYLEGEELVLVGNGFNDEALMSMAYDLEFKGFRDVKMLANGRRSKVLSDTNEKSDATIVNRLHFVDAVSALSAAATSSLHNEYVFLLWGANVEQLTKYGIEYSLLSGEKPENILENLQQTIEDVLNKNRHTKLLLVFSNDNQKKYVLGDDKLQNVRSLWVLAGGVDSLLRAIRNTKIAPIRLRDHQFSCRTR